ncbi:MAG TPA: cytochrome P450 [Polyangiales bacterium]|nr:cytochrome P450 [Polyangiales bacterium]
MRPSTNITPHTNQPSRRDSEVRPGDFGAPRPPRLSGAPVLGNLAEFLSDPYGMFIRGYRSLGPVFSVRFLHRPMLVLAGAEGLRFLSKQGRELLESKPVWQEFVTLFGGERALVSVDGELHAELRKRLRPSMSRSTLENRLPEVREVVQRCLRRWDGQTVDVERFTRDLIFHELAALMDMAGIDPDEYYEDLLRVMHTSIEVTVGRRWPRFLLWNPRFRAAKQRIMNMGIDLFRSVGQSNPEDGLFPILRRCVQDGLLGERDIPLLAMTPYFAGIDTVASTLSFALSAVYRRPDLQTALRKELEAASADSPTGREWLDRLKLAEAVKLEVSRRYPVTLTMVRFARSPFVYAGRQVRAGDQLLISVGAQSLMHEYFEDPERFDPMRFVGPDALRPEAGTLNPYGMGPHTCLGAALADVQVIATLALLLELADIELIDPERPLEMKYTPYPLPKGDRLRIRMRNRRRIAKKVTPTSEH